MTLDEIKNAKRQTPFVPFRIRMADGREIPITHPDAISWSGSERVRTVHAVLNDGSWEVIDLSLVTSIGSVSVESGI